MKKLHSKVEEYFLNRSGSGFSPTAIEHVPVITVDNYVELGKLTALRFIEWIIDNPEGVVSLPTGKTPEYFIKWLDYYLKNWSKESRSGTIAEIGISGAKPPSFRGLHFVQMDEFFPFNPDHERSFNNYVRRFYLKPFGFDVSKALLIDTNSIPGDLRNEIPSNFNSMEELFGDDSVDFTLRFRRAVNEKEKFRQKAIRYFDFFCQEYERKIREMGGIGFFLGGIGPDGHIAFNVKGSDHFSTTRLTNLNYESMAAAAGDLGGIENVKRKAVVTIGLGTITLSLETVAVIFAAGQAKASVIASAVTGTAHTDFPATALYSLPNARMFLTHGAASKLLERNLKKIAGAGCSNETVIENLIYGGAFSSGKSLTSVKESSESIPVEWRIAKKLCGKPLKKIADTVRETLMTKIKRGISIPDNQNILHTAPHHDDIELAYFPLIHHLVRSISNVNNFCYLTSGFTSVTNAYVLERLVEICDYIKDGSIFRVLNRDKPHDPSCKEREIQSYLNAIASGNVALQNLFASARLIRNIMEFSADDSIPGILDSIEKQIGALKMVKPGSIDSELIQMIKSRIREWEADTVWAHFGLREKQVHHMRLKFYTSDIFPNDPQFTRDVMPIVALLNKVKPSIVTLAFDPEGSGPDTHYKCLTALRAAVEKYVNEHNRFDLRIWGYRNVWSRFSPDEATTIIPVSLNSFAVLENMFNTCFVSQRTASFPSYELDGTFAQLGRKIWVEQFKDLTLLLGKEYFYESDHPMMRRAFGAIYLKDMSYEEFMKETENIKTLEECKRPLLKKQGNDH